MLFSPSRLRRLKPLLLAIVAALLLPLCYPFVCGALAAALAARLAALLGRATRLRPSACRRLALAVVLLGLWLLLRLGLPVLQRELSVLQETLIPLRQQLAPALARLDFPLAALPQTLREAAARLGAAAQTLLLGLADALISLTAALSWLLGAAAAVPTLTLVLIACTAWLLPPRLAAVRDTLRIRLPEDVRQAARRANAGIAALRHAAVRALPLFTLRAGVLLLAGLALGLPCPLLLALLLPAVELLPCFGAGWLLLPAAYVGVLLSNRPLAVGSALLYAWLLLTRLVFRQKKTAPRHPLGVLVAAWLGYRFGGIAGLLVLPAALLLVLRLRRNVPAADAAQRQS